MAVERMQVISQHLRGRDEICRPSLSATSTAENFRYTRSNTVLSYEQRKFYEDNGYLVIPRLIEDDLIEKFRQRFIDICNDKVPRREMLLMKEISLKNTGAKGEYLCYKLEDFVWDTVLSEYVFHPKLLDYVESIIGPNIKSMHTMLINKPPDSGKLTSVHPLHQDLHYFPFRPVDRIVAAWTAMETVNEDNGCLVVIPGTHKGKLLPHGYPKWDQGVNKAFHSVEGYEDHPLLSLKMEKGDTVFFHPLIVHGSGVNLTKGFRKAISSHFAAADCYFIDVKGTLQETIGKEVAEMGKIRGYNLNFQSAFERTSRLVRGTGITV